MTTESISQDLARRRASAQAAEKAQAASSLSSANVPYKCKLLVVTAIHASLMYASTTWWPLTPKQQEEFAVTYTSPIKRAVGGAWSPKSREKPVSNRDALSLAAFPRPETALRIARLRLLSRLSHGPVVLLALLQTHAGTEWQQTTRDDLQNFKITLSGALQKLPSPADGPVPWPELIQAFPLQWKQLLRCYRSEKVLEQQVEHQLGSGVRPSVYPGVLLQGALGRAI